MLDLRRTCRLQTLMRVSPRRAVSNLHSTDGASMTNIRTTRRLRTQSRRRPTARAEPVLLDRPTPTLSREGSSPVRPMQMPILEPRRRATRRVDARRRLPYRALYATLRRTRVRSAALPTLKHARLITCNFVTTYQ